MIKSLQIMTFQITKMINIWAIHHYSQGKAPVSLSLPLHPAGQPPPDPRVAASPALPALCQLHASLCQNLKLQFSL